MFAKRRILSVVFVICVFLSAFVAADEAKTYKIGVLAKRGTERCLAKWTATADYLTETIDSAGFEIVPLDFEQIYPTVEAGKVDFVIANPSFYVNIETEYGAGRIATLKNLRQGKVCTVFGGVIFTKAGSAINKLTDLKGKRFMAADKTSFGGWQMAWRELKDCSIDPYKDFADLLFGGTHDAVVYAVGNGKVSAAELIGQYWPWLLGAAGALLAMVAVSIRTKRLNIKLGKSITGRKQSELKFRTLYESSSDAVMLLDEKGFFDCNEATVKMFACENKEEFCSKHPADQSPPNQPCGTDSLTLANERIATAMKEGSNHFDWVHQRTNGVEFPADVLLNAMELDGKKVLQAVVRDITNRKKLENQLRQAEKLQSIGQLASGIAHEINTPIQYISDNINFLQDSIKDIFKLLNEYEQMQKQAAAGKVDSDLLSRVSATLGECDMDYLIEEVPRAIKESLEGVGIVSRIVQSMKEFAHSGAQTKTTVDLNQAIASTITVSRNKWKYAADLETDFDSELPPVTCLVGEFNQVILNLIINAADAITEKMGDDAEDKGTITISTRQDGDWAEIRVTDTGTGISEENRRRIMDPFFTTKEVGKGSGQGLAIAHSIIVDKHGGTLTFETEMDKGTTFIIRLPIEPDVPSGEDQDEEAYSIC